MIVLARQAFGLVHLVLDPVPVAAGVRRFPVPGGPPQGRVRVIVTPTVDHVAGVRLGHRVVLELCAIAHAAAWHPVGVLELVIANPVRRMVRVVGR